MATTPHMLATIDSETERKLQRDRDHYGVAYMRVLEDGRIEHVPLDEAGEPRVPRMGQPWTARRRAA